MFIQTEQTPNPASLKFLPGREVLTTGTADFADLESARAGSPLAERLFGVDGVNGVFLGPDFITVSKDTEKEWYLLKPSILGVIMEHFTTGAPVLAAGADAALGGHDAGDHAAEDDEIVTQIKELLDMRVRPAVAQDGGDIVYQGYQDGVVYLHLRGSCAGCPSSTMTLKSGIENMLRHYIPEITEVRAAT